MKTRQKRIEQIKVNEIHIKFYRVHLTVILRYCFLEFYFPLKVSNFRCTENKNKNKNKKK